MRFTTTAATIGLLASASVSLAKDLDFSDIVLEDRSVHSLLHMRDDMIKHTVLRRENGNDVHIYVNRNYIEADAAGAYATLFARDDKNKKNDTKPADNKKPAENKKKVKKTFKVNVVDASDIIKYSDDPKPKDNKDPKKVTSKEALDKAKAKFEAGRCGASSFKNTTTKDSPYTGGCQALVNWAASRKGKWTLSAQVKGNVDLLVAGSNSGANCRFVVRNPTGKKTFIATSDVRDLVRDSRRRFQVTYGSKPGQGQRMGAEGTMKCDTKFKNGTIYKQQVDWAILKSDQRV